MLLCCGEDAEELLAAVREALPRVTPALVHHYRCYQFWDLGQATLAWTGIGTGCLEPFLFEVLDSGVVRRIVLVGTAGATAAGQKSLRRGESYVVSSATVFADGVQPRSAAPCTFRWSPPPLNRPSATVVSTDYYYGFSARQDPKSIRLRAQDRQLSAGFQHITNRTELVDMETGQFYHLCHCLAPETLEYIAVRGPANILGESAGQTEFSPRVLQHAVKTAFELLG